MCFELLFIQDPAGIDHRRLAVRDDGRYTPLVDLQDPLHIFCQILTVGGTPVS